MQILGGLFGALIGSVLEMDEIYQERLPDGRLKVVFLTTGISDKLVDVKTRIFALLNLPVQKVDEIKITLDQGGAFFKRYRIEAILSPLFGVKQ